MDKYKKENKNEYIKNKLNYGMYYYTFIHDYVEQEVSKRNFNFNSNLILITDLVGSKYNIPSFMYKSLSIDVFTETLISHIHEVGKFKTIDLTDAEHKLCLYLNIEEPLIKSILVKTLKDVLEDKKKVITFKRTIN